MTWNPLDPASPLRSARVQAAVALLLQTGFAAIGVNIGDELLGGFVEQGNLVLAGLSTLWLAIGSIRAQSSARPF